VARRLQAIRLCLSRGAKTKLSGTAASPVAGRHAAASLRGLFGVGLPPRSSNPRINSPKSQQRSFFANTSLQMSNPHFVILFSAIYSTMTLSMTSLALPPLMFYALLRFFLLQTLADEPGCDKGGSVCRNKHDSERTHPQTEQMFIEASKPQHVCVCMCVCVCVLNSPPPAFSAPDYGGDCLPSVCVRLHQVMQNSVPRDRPGHAELVKDNNSSSFLLCHPQALLSFVPFPLVIFQSAAASAALFNVVFSCFYSNLTEIGVRSDEVTGSSQYKSCSFVLELRLCSFYLSWESLRRRVCVCVCLCVCVWVTETLLTAGSLPEEGEPSFSSLIFCSPLFMKP